MPEVRPDSDAASENAALLHPVEGRSMYDARLMEICHVVHTLVVINFLVLSVYHLMMTIQIKIFATTMTCMSLSTKINAG